LKTPDRTGNPALDATVQNIVRDFARIVPTGSDMTGRTDASTIEFIVPHRMGEKPDFFIYFPWSDIRVFATEENQRKWTTTSIAVTASAAGVVTLFVGKL